MLATFKMDGVKTGDLGDSVRPTVPESGEERTSPSSWYGR